jgi:hypothetical protein
VAMTRARKRLYLSRSGEYDAGFLSMKMEDILMKNQKQLTSRNNRNLK